MRADVALLTKEEGGSPLRNPSTASEDARVASLISLEDILKQAEVFQNPSIFACWHILRAMFLQGS